MDLIHKFGARQTPAPAELSQLADELEELKKKLKLAAKEAREEQAEVKILGFEAVPSK